MIRRGCLFALLGILGGLGLVFEGVDVAARHYATSRVEQRIRASAPEARGVRVRILGWPFLQVVVNGHIDSMQAHADRVAERGLVFSRVEVDVRGVTIDQGRLVSEGKVTVKSIRDGTATASITAGDLSSALGVPVTIGSAGFVVRGAPLTVSINPSPRAVLIRGVGVIAPPLPLPGPNLLPCLPGVSFADGDVVLSCTFTQIPSAFTSS